MRFHTTIHLSEHISKTPEGYLLCCDVPIARTGCLDYAADELPEEIAKGHKVVRVHREAADLFDPSAMASYEGKPLTVDHPEDFVHPDNFREESRGHVQNVRRGQGADDDLLLADILVMDAEVIALVERGLRELSCGYDADYECVRPGVVKQTHFLGNHVALVDRGRCGSRCAIKDSAEIIMKGKASWLDKIMGNPKVRRAMRDAEAEELKTGDEDTPASPATQDTGEEVESAPATDNADLVQKLDEITLLLRSLLEKQGDRTGDEDGQVADEGGTCDTDEAAKTEDEEAKTEEAGPASAKTSDRRRVADAALLQKAVALAPALRFRAGDTAALVQRATLRSASQNAEVSRVVTACLGSHTLDSAPTSLLNAAFVAASTLVGRRHNTRTADALTGAKGKDRGANVPTPASINALNRDFYKK